MALIKCKECGKEILDNAKTCPHCGNSIQSKIYPKEKRSELKILGITMGIIIILYIFAINSTNQTNIMKETGKKNETAYYSIGETVNYTDWKIKVLNVENTKKLKNTYDSIETKNNYVIVNLQITNLQNEPASLLTSKSELGIGSYKIYATPIFELHSANKTYTTNDNLENYVDNKYNIFFDKMNPNTSITYKAVFETDYSTDEKNFTFSISGSNKKIKLY